MISVRKCVKFEKKKHFFLYFIFDKVNDNLLIKEFSEIDGQGELGGSCLY